MKPLTFFEPGNAWYSDSTTESTGEPMTVKAVQNSFPEAHVNAPSMGAVDGYSTDDENWRKREHVQRRAQACKDVSDIVKKIVGNRDRGVLAKALGVERRTFSNKMAEGRFTAAELFELSYLCGFEIKAEDKWQLMMDLILED